MTERYYDIKATPLGRIEVYSGGILCMNRSEWRIRYSTLFRCQSCASAEQ